jgi:NADPH:quinone reductase-like Zn-dependent oxidoreductase
VLRRVVRQVEAGVYRPHLDHVFGLDDIAAATGTHGERRGHGKFVAMP